jgi:HK97 family phage major capsid protein
MNRTQIIARLEEIGGELDSFDAENLDEQTEARYDVLVGEADELRSTLQKVESREAKREELRQAVETGKASTTHGEDRGAPQYMKKVEPFDGEDVRYMRPEEVRDRALAALDSRGLTQHLNDKQKERVEGLLRQGKSRNFDPAELSRRLLISEDANYRSAFQKMVTQAQPVLTSDEGRALERAASLNNTSGGFGVPVFIDPSIILTAQGSGNPVLEIARVETITTNQWKGVSSAGVSWSFDVEGAEVSDDTPTLAQPTVVAHTARGFIPYSIEIGGDYPGFANEMSTLLLEGYLELLAQKLVVGSGTNEPRGIFTALDANTNVEVAVTTNDAFAAVDIYKVWKELPERYRDNSNWLMNVDLNNRIKQFGDDQLSRQTNSLAGGPVDLIQGRPVRESAYAPALSTDDSANLLVVGDFRNYLVAQRLGMTVELVPHLFGTTNGRPTGQRGWFAYSRVGGNSVNDLGFRVLQNGVSG